LKIRLNRRDAGLKCAIECGFVSVVHRFDCSPRRTIVARSRLHAELELVNGSTGDPVLLVDYPDRDDALLLDAGDNSALSLDRLADLRAVFVSHHHVDHFIGLDRIVRANIDADKTVSIFGPVETIQKVYDRIAAYEYPFFPFQKIVLDVVEVTDTTLRSARLDCGRRFPRPEIHETPRKSTVIFETETLAVEAAAADHTVPCLSYSVTEKPGHYVDLAAIQKGILRPGPWIAEVAGRLRSGLRREDTLEIDGGRFLVRDLAARDRLLTLAHRSTRLYCDSFYLDAQRSAAEKHRHTTARQTAEFARDAEVDELILIHFSGRYSGRYDRLVDEARAIFPRTTAEIR
jgi:ribonuclease Z